jgi:hypothetical protein
MDLWEQVLPAQNLMARPEYFLFLIRRLRSEAAVRPNPLEFSHITHKSRNQIPSEIYTLVRIIVAHYHYIGVALVRKWFPSKPSRLQKQT